LRAAQVPGAPTLCDEAPDNIAAEMRHGNADATAAAFAQAAHVVNLNIRNQRVAAVTLEPRTVLAYADATDGRLTLRMSTQMPSGVRDSVAKLLGLPPEQMRVVVDDVGGGFGMKTGMYAEDAAVAYAARVVGRPVKWVAERSEEFLSTAHGRDLDTRAQLALDAQGKILGLRVHSQANVGAYALGTGVAIQLLIGPWVQTSVYDIQTIDFHFKAILTNTASTGAYRGAGRPEAIFTMERLMDEAARQTGIDRVTLRRRNFIQPTQMPYKNPMGQVYDTGDFEHIMNQGLALADWDGFAARAAASHARGKLRGLGLATFLEWTGGNVFQERVTVTVLPDGIVEAFCAVNAMGQGIATTLAQLMVDVFGLPLERIRVVLGDTDRGTGFGSAGSRSIFTGGSALQVGAQRTLDKAKALAADELEVAADDIAYDGGRFTVKGTDLSVDLFSLAQKQSDHRIHIESTNTVAGPTWPNGCHVSEVEVDPQTGEVQIVAVSERCGPRYQPHDRARAARRWCRARHWASAVRAGHLRHRNRSTRDRQLHGLQPATCRRDGTGLQNRDGHFHSLQKQPTGRQRRGRIGHDWGNPQHRQRRGRCAGTGRVHAPSVATANATDRAARVGGDAGGLSCAVA
jgi:aerobic carbon-monoxide dehydrogenase large subunit